MSYLTFDWQSKKTEILLNPRLPSETIASAQARLPVNGDFERHLWLATSGSTADKKGVKYVALSKEAFLASAEAVNRHLNLNSKDTWINPLPLFHVGGLAIFARAFLNNAKVALFKDKWMPEAFCNFVESYQGTLSALVPTQVYDLVSAQLKAPPSLRAVIVGGGQLSKLLYVQARTLGWKLLPSYGLTEASSQVATATETSKQYPSMLILPHVQVCVNDEGCLKLKGPSLLSAYAFVTDSVCQLHDPKVGGWLQTEDRGEVNDDVLLVFGRDADFIKVGGENVNLKHLESILEAIRLKLKLTVDVALVALEDARLGHAVHLAVGGVSHPQIDQLVETFQQAVLPFERIRQVHYLPSLPRSPLNKLLPIKINNHSALKK